MGNEKPTYEELESRVASAEGIFKAVSDDKIDALVGKKGVYLLRFKEMEAALGRSAEKFKVAELEAVINTMSEGLCISDMEGNILAMNLAVRRQHGFPDGAEISLHLHEYADIFELRDMSGRRLPVEAWPLSRAIRGHLFSGLELKLYRKDLGTELILEYAGGPVRNPSGKPFLAVISARDITAQKRAAETIQSAKEQLEFEVQQRTADLNQRADQLARISSQLTLAEQRERRRIAEILHDELQQWLVAAKMNQEILIDGMDPALKSAAEYTLDLINRSIKCSRSLTTELSPPVLRSGDLSAAFKWLARWMHENQGFEVRLQSEAGILLDRKDLTILLFQSVRELLLNVLKHAGVKSVDLRVYRKNGELCLVVSDTGRGCDPESVWKSAECEKFGLISIRERLLHLGGRFIFESWPNGGVTASLVIPLPENEPDKQYPQGSGEKQPAKPVSAAGPKDKLRLMIVDDHTVLRQGLSAMFGLQADIEVVGEADDGERAVHLARELVPDSILMDVEMPNMDGLEATRIIHAEFPHIRIIGLSMYADDSYDAGMIAAGACAYRCKSDTAELLLAAVRGEAEMLRT